MDRDEALKLLNGGADGIAEWNRRRQPGDTIPDLRGADLSAADLRLADLRLADLRLANLNDADLHAANLSGTDLSAADLRHANLTAADLRHADLTAANLHRTDLSKADLTGAKLSEANLHRADLRSADLSDANLTAANLSDANFEGAHLLATAFSSVNLSEAQGLESVVFRGPCEVSLSTLVASKGQIPEFFLGGCGFQPWQVLEAKLYDPALTRPQICDLQTQIFTARTKGPLLLGGVFISYAHADAAFVDKLHKSLQDESVSIWLDRHDLVAGPLDRQVVDAIRLNDVVLLVLSESSVNSDWVDYELKKALEKERDEHRDVLCPVALDTAWEAKTEQVLWHKVKEKNILDFSDWQTDAFTPQFAKLLKGLKIYYNPADK